MKIIVVILTAAIAFSCHSPSSLSSKQATSAEGEISSVSELKNENEMNYDLIGLEPIKFDSSTIIMGKGGKSYRVILMAEFDLSTLGPDLHQDVVENTEILSVGTPGDSSVALPDWVFEFKKLRVLMVGKMFLPEPEKLSSLPLEHLSFTGTWSNDRDQLFDVLGKHKSLKTLTFSTKPTVLECEQILSHNRQLEIMDEREFDERLTKGEISLNKK